MFRLSNHNRNYTEFRYEPSFTWPNILRDGLRKAAKRLNLAGVMLPGEILWHEFSHDGFAVTVRFYSARPEEMLERMQKIAFPSFGPQQRTPEGWLSRVTFRVM